MINRLLFLFAQGTNLFPEPTNLPRGSADNAVAVILRLVFGVLGGIAVLIVTIAGFQYIISQGDPQKIAKAKNTIIFAVIGLAIALTGFSIVNFVVNRI
jgi:hypothetical protein